MRREQSAGRGREASAAREASIRAPIAEKRSPKSVGGILLASVKGGLLVIGRHLAAFDVSRQVSFDFLLISYASEYIVCIKP